MYLEIVAFATKKWVKGLITVKYAIYVGGILLLTLGIALTIQSNLGASPFDALKKEFKIT